MARTDLPLPRLIEERIRELGLRRPELVARCGYKNIAEFLLKRNHSVPRHGLPPIHS